MKQKILIFSIVYCVLAIYIAVILYAFQTKPQVSVSQPISIHDYHDEQSPIIGTLPPEYSIYAMYDNGQSCWAVVKMGDQLGWVNTDQLLSARSKCWLTGYATPTPSTCIQDGQYNDCVR